MRFEINGRLDSGRAPGTEPAFARWRSVEGEVVTTFHRIPDGYLVRFKERADFTVSLSRRVVTCRPGPGVSRRAAEDLYLNQVLPLIHGQEGDLMVHASAVAVDGAVIAFAGPTGAGKSTLAAGFARAGMPFLSDDGVRLTQEDGRYVAAPNRPSFRLWQDSEAAVVSGTEVLDDAGHEKTHVAASEALPFQDQPLPLHTLYFLGHRDCAEVRFELLRAQVALAELINHSFLLDVADKARLQAHFDALAKLSASVPAFLLYYPRDYDRLGDVITAIVAHSRRRIPVQ